MVPTPGTFDGASGADDEATTPSAGPSIEALGVTDGFVAGGAAEDTEEDVVTFAPAPLVRGSSLAEVGTTSTFSLASRVKT